MFRLPNQIHSFGPFPASSLPFPASDARQYTKHVSDGMILYGKHTVHLEGKTSDMKRLQTPVYQGSLHYLSFLLHGHAYYREIIHLRLL